MTELESDVVVKNEVPDITDEEDQSLEPSLPVLNEDIKTEDDISDGRRRSRRLQQNPTIIPKVVKHVQEDMEEKLTQKFQKKYASKQKRLSSLSEEDRMILKEKAKMSYLARRQKQKEMGIVPEKKKKRNQPTKPKKPTSEAQKERSKFRRILKEAHMSEEELAQLRAKRYMQRHAYIASKTKEELEEMKVRKRKRYEENRQRYLEKQRMWRASLTGEKKERYLASVYKAIKKHYEKMKSQKDDITGIDKWKEKNVKCVERQKKIFATEPPEARQKRLLSYKINQARRKLRERLEKEGVPPHIIEMRVDELVKEMKSRPMPPPSEYKPREKLREECVDEIVVRKRRRRSQTKVNMVNEGPSPCDSNSGERYDGVEAVAASHNFQHFVASVPVNIRNVEIPRCDWQLTNNLFQFQILPTVAVSQPAPAVSSTLPCINVSTTPVLCVAREVIEGRRQITASSNEFSPPCSPMGGNDDHLESVSSPEPLLSQEEKVFPSTILPPVSLVSSETSSPPLLLHPPEKSPKPPSEIFKCPQCPEVLSTDQNLRSHLGTSHPLACWKCPKCYEVMLSPAELSNHFKTHLQSSLSICHKSKSSKIGNVFIKTETETPHRSEFKDRRRKNANFLCMKCPYQSSPTTSSSIRNRFQTLEQLCAHVKRRHLKSFWPCPNCKVLKYSKDRLEFHMKSCLIATDNLGINHTKKNVIVPSGRRRK